MVVFHYGSIVLFNVREHEVDEYLKVVERHASGLLPEMRKDGELHFFCCVCSQWCFVSHLWFCKTAEYEVREDPNLDTWMKGGRDFIRLQFLYIDGIRTIGSVLGQSIALDYYGRQVTMSNPYTYSGM